MDTPRKHITLLELQTLIKRALEGALPLTQWVVAEVSELKVNYSGHCYMQLVEKGGRKELPQATAGAVAWRSSWGAIAAHFHTATGNDIAPGMKLLLRVAVSYHEIYGLSLVVSDIDPSYTLGDIERQRQQTIARLQADGVFEMNRESGLPALLQRIAVVSSRNAAGYQDFMRELEQSPYRFETTLFDAFMQGEGAEDSIVAALGLIAEDPDRFDAVVMIRGGGSQSDLACFNAYRLCAHVAQFPLPVITGIGHDKDRSVADMVSALELKTPTAVAAYLVERMAGEADYLAAMRERLVRHVSGGLDIEKQRIIQRGIGLSRTVAAMSRALERRLGELAAGIAHRGQAALTRRHDRLATLDALLAERAARVTNAQSDRLKLLSGRIDAHDPQHILSLGFAIVRCNGRALKDSAGVLPGQPLEITLAKGKMTANVEKTE